MAACACAGGVGTPCSNNLISGNHLWGLYCASERARGRRIQAAASAWRLIHIAPEAYACGVVHHARRLTARAIDQCACDAVWRRLIWQHSVLTCPHMGVIYPLMLQMTSQLPASLTFCRLPWVFNVCISLSHRRHFISGICPLTESNRIAWESPVQAA